MARKSKKTAQESTPVPEPDNGLTIQEIIEKEQFHWKQIDQSITFDTYDFHWKQYEHYQSLKLNYKK